MKTRKTKLKRILGLTLVLALVMSGISAFTVSAAPNNYGFTAPFLDRDPSQNITNYFTNSDYTKGHTGVDYSWANINGTPILATKSGVVTASKTTTTGYGCYVIIKHDAEFSTLYAHMNATPLVAENNYVQQGQVIGYVGSTGNSTGPHLHFEVRRNNVAVDPLSYITGASNPLSIGRMVAGDFNGDGKDDIATMYNYGNSTYALHTFISNGSGFAKTQWWNNGTEYDPNKVNGRMVAGDFNGDGKDDIATLYQYNSDKYAVHVFLSNGNGFDGPKWWHNEVGYDVNRVTGRVVAGDFDGNGKDDIAAIYDAGDSNYQIHYFDSDGTKFTGRWTWLTDSQYYVPNITGRVVAGDFTGDGRDDIAAMYDYGNSKYTIHTFVSSTSGFSKPQWWNQGTSYDPKKITGRMVAGDFDNNGVDDISVMYDTGNDNYKIDYFDSQRNGFTGPWTWLTDTQYPTYKVAGLTVAGDFSGDGRCDIATMYDYGNSQFTFHTFQSSTSGFSKPQWWLNETSYKVSDVRY